MGWGSGAEIAVEVAEAVRKGVETTSLSERQAMSLRKRILREVVEDFSNCRDWDTQPDAHGNDDALDAVLEEMGFISDEEEEVSENEDVAALEKEVKKLEGSIETLQQENKRLREHLEVVKSDLKAEAGAKALLQTEYRADRESTRLLSHENNVFRIVLNVPFAKKLTAEDLDAIRTDGFTADKWMRVFAMRVGIVGLAREAKSEDLARAIDAALVGKLTGT